MLTEALKSDRIIGIVLVRGERDDIEEPPPIHPVGCAGLVSHAEPLPDGCSNIILRGLQRFRIVQEEHGRSYRRAQIAPLPETLSDASALELRQTRTKLESLLAGRLETDNGEVMVQRDMGDEDLVNTLAQYLDLDPLEKQALLQFDDLVSRSRALIELLEMREFTTQPLRSLGLH